MTPVDHDDEGERFKTPLDANRLKQLGDELRSILHLALSEESLRAFCNRPDGWPVLSDVLNVPTWLRQIAEGKSIKAMPYAYRFATSAQIIIRGAARKNGEKWVGELRRAIERNDPEGFTDRFFEGEVACLFVDRLGAAGTGFGPTGGHPDVEARFKTNGPSKTVPIECKRLRDSTAGRERQLMQELFPALQLVGRRVPFQANVRLRRPLRNYADATEITASVESLIEALQAMPAGEWLTTADETGSRQISVRLLSHEVSQSEEAGFRQNADPLAFFISGSRLGREADDSYTMRLTFVFSLASDDVGGGLDQLSNNFSKAVEQLKLRATPGMIAVRLPPLELPRLLEADRIVRHIMRRPESQLATLAILAFDNPKLSLALGTPPFATGLYFVRSPWDEGSPAPDSYTEVFGSAPEAVVRHAVKGIAVPVSQQTIEEIRSGSDVPVSLNNFRVELPDDQAAAGSHVFSVLMPPRVGPSRNEVVFLLTAGCRQFRVLLENRYFLRAFEIVGGHPIRHCAIDLWAWLDEQLQCRINWRSDWFEVVAGPGSVNVDQIVARSASVRAVGGADGNEL